jgi:putative oxidoreductase
VISHGSALDVSILLIRLVLGVTMALHGGKKVFGAGGVGAVAAWFGSIGIRPPRPNAIAAAATELGAGVALAVGVLTPLAAAAFVSLMLVAVWTALRTKGFWVTGGGWEYNLVLAVSAAGIGGIGAGRFSVDHAFRDVGFAHLLSGWAGLAIAVGVGIGAGVAQLAACYRPPK